MKKAIITLAIICLSLGLLSACENNESTPEQEEIVIDELKSDLLSQIDGIGSVGEQIDKVYRENYDNIYEKIYEAFNESYYNKLNTVLKEKLSNKTEKLSFNASYDEVFKEVYEEFYDNFRKSSKNVIYLDDDEYTDIYNNAKDKYYADLSKLFID